jgi:hypothetical protein
MNIPIIWHSQCAVESHLEISIIDGQFRSLALNMDLKLGQICTELFVMIDTKPCVYVE